MRLSVRVGGGGGIFAVTFRLVENKGPAMLA